MATNQEGVSIVEIRDFNVNINNINSKSKAKRSSKTLYSNKTTLPYYNNTNPLINPYDNEARVIENDIITLNGDLELTNSFRYEKPEMGQFYKGVSANSIKLIPSNRFSFGATPHGVVLKAHKDFIFEVSNKSIIENRSKCPEKYNENYYRSGEILVETIEHKKNIYPNPFHTELHVEVTSNEVQIHDLLGKQIYIGEPGLINMEDQADGMYIVSWEEEGELKTEKVVLSK